MFKKIVITIGSWWNTSAKERVSRLLYGHRAWEVPVIKALGQRGILLDGCRDPRDVSDRIRGKLFYSPDWLGGLGDSTKPPAVLVREGGGDCEDFALLHALAIKAVLGWRSFYCVYIAWPLGKSHAFAAAYSPEGELWILDPQPTKKLLEEKPDYQNAHQLGKDFLGEVFPRIPGLLWKMVKEV